jgi:hypothetical protein
MAFSEISRTSVFLGSIYNSNQHTEWATDVVRLLVPQNLSELYNKAQVPISFPVFVHLYVVFYELWYSKFLPKVTKQIKISCQIGK